MPSTKFFDIVSDLVYLHMKMKGKSYRDISIILNLNESYVRQIHSRSVRKRYSLVHLSILSYEWGIPIGKFIPSESTIQLLTEFSNHSERERKEFIKKLYEELRGENYG